MHLSKSRDHANVLYYSPQPHWRRKWQPNPMFLPGKSHGQNSLTGNSPWGCRADKSEQLSTHALNTGGTLGTHCIFGRWFVGACCVVRRRRPGSQGSLGVTDFLLCLPLCCLLCNLLGLFYFFKIIFVYVFTFGCAGSSWLHRLFSSCSERGVTL